MCLSLRTAPLLVLFGATLACSSGKSGVDNATADSGTADLVAPATTASGATPDAIRALAGRLNTLSGKTRWSEEEGWHIVSAKGTGDDADAELFAASYSEGGDCSQGWSVIRRGGDIVQYTRSFGCAGEMYPTDVEHDTLFFDQGKAIGGTATIVTIHGEGKPNTVKSTPFTNEAKIQKALTLANAIVAVDKAALTKLNTN